MYFFNFSTIGVVSDGLNVNNLAFLHDDKCCVNVPKIQYPFYVVLTVTALFVRKEHTVAKHSGRID